MKKIDANHNNLHLTTYNRDKPDGDTKRDGGINTLASGVEAIQVVDYRLQGNTSRCDIGVFDAADVTTEEEGIRGGVK